MKPPIVGVANAQDRPKSKYRNVKTAGHASKKEAKRAQELRLLEKKGLIADLLEQERFLLIPKQDGERAVYYVSDFTYRMPRYDLPKTEWPLVVEDCKGYRTDVYKIKRKLMLWVRGITITET